MRLDDYRCSDCGRVFEALLDADEAAHCPACASERTERQLSGFAIGGSGAQVGRASTESDLPSYGGCANGMCGL
jgi:putative FmdB family regulatory protein